MHSRYCLCPACIRDVSLQDDETREQARAAIAVCALQDKARLSEQIRPGVRRRPARPYARATMHRDAPGGHFPDCDVTEAGEVLLCHCPLECV